MILPRRVRPVTAVSPMAGTTVVPSDSLDGVRDYSARFRASIEAAIAREGNKLPCSLARFPRGSCGDAAILLGEFLFLSGFGEFEYVSGSDGDGSHAWIEKGGVIIEITADQFGGEYPSVLVTRNSPLYQRFCRTRRHPARIEHYDDVTEANLREAFSIIIS